MTTNESRYASFVNIQLKGITDDQVKTIIQNWMYSTTDADFTLGTNALMVMKQKSRFFFFPQEIGHELWHLRNDNGSQTNTRASARV
jgi:hypothetical protein